MRERANLRESHRIPIGTKVGEGEGEGRREQRSHASTTFFSRVFRAENVTETVQLAKSTAPLYLWRSAMGEGRGEACR